MSQPVAHELSHNAPGTVNGSSALDTPYIASSTDNNPAQHSYHVAVEQNHPQEIPAPIALGQFPNPAKEKPPPYSFFDGETAAAAREQAHSAVPAPNTNAQDPTTTSETAPPPPLTKEPIQFAFAASNYLKSPSNLDPANVDLNKLGILYEYSDSYFVVLEVPPYPGGAAALRRGFMRRDVVGAYLRAEWASLFKERIGDGGRGVSAAGGRWYVYSVLIQQMRVVCSTRAREVEGRIAGSGVGEHQVKRVLEGVFSGVVNEVYAVWRRGVEERGREGDAFIREFMVLGEYA